MLLRGTISYGTYSLSERLIIGEALDDAAYHHDKLNWIGIALSPSLSSPKDIEAVTSESFTFCSFIPHKETPYDGLVLNWPKFDTDKLCYSILEEEKENGKDPIKYDNTFAFYHDIIGVKI